ncbi:Ni,Fe-hydrogenase III small subunit [Anaerobacterium chartisolvens]|uniref:Ni,Fe-hydrogenase III small subunit n=1 Tax=Anaerobacterium chartisolvens TaxID=1297424 RepID=A0A369B8J0_9FIRM|nr:NADH-quinone oxidoreductase subunit NuoB [Anaerobacterium chartisolvens]RCX16866.1 Ni,Fe-hydrogenase III small subunit [Anaerobacterium chartisolvens]
MFNIIKKSIQHGVVTVDYPKKPIKTDFITGKPEIDITKCNVCGQCIERCPSGAIVKYCRRDGQQSIGINVDECIFCSLCADICPQGAIAMSKEFELAKKSRDELRVTEAGIKAGDERKDCELIGKQLKHNINKYFGRSLNIREVDAGSCNGCDNEANALNGPYNDIERFGISFVASPRHADMLLVTGPTTRNMELALIKTYNATPDPKLVVALGACACSGGIFKDSYATRNGIDSIVPVDVYIPGCPPRPQAIIYGILKAVEKHARL